jgi:hypothetical protein
MELEEGRAYTNRSEVFGREIIALEGKNVQYRDFMLSTGEPIASFRVCSRGTFRTFAVRLCTDEEIARFRRDESARKDKSLFDAVQGRLFGLLTAAHQIQGEQTEITPGTPKATQTQRSSAKLIAMIVRNAMEDFHAAHLSDDQMRELNPLIRNAICTGLHALENLSDQRVMTYCALQKAMIPTYWEEPELLRDYLESISDAEKMRKPKPQDGTPDSR